MQTCQGVVSMVARSSVMTMAAGGEQVVGPGQVEEQRGPNAEWILKVGVEVTQNDDSIGMQSKTGARVLVKATMNEGCDPGRHWVSCNKDSDDMEFR